MFGIDGPEFLVILLVLIVVVGPKDLPKMLKTMARAMAYVRSKKNEFRRQFDDAIRQVELDDLQKTLADINDFNLSKELTETFNPIHDAVENVQNFDVNARHHKLEKDKEILLCDQNKDKEDIIIPVDLQRSEGISTTSKDKEDTS
ncbi:twin arginine-targeting protein translocase TatB [Bartonella vinsonii subsp. arupensis OK-94-513]|uniref:Twin arginine-targeting protein translocase TatB n=2 Tax=Bartonella vinsonii subsp. arupensis TaxID=110578 RepID=J1JRC8_BARVI|nr:Sec-independent protein translocase protein TatB [Bartonella vinsonii]EJF86945.1 twin arginine-targeting protein translocase TatB [Bartonella vinsonii subsp. arupensis OK-94-513]EJF98780.1 twin arginine-targeting protein translocase TatB [Bartonella vinsonii subsp. arupensis Pm136co]